MTATGREAFPYPPPRSWRPGTAQQAAIRIALDLYNTTNVSDKPRAIVVSIAREKHGLIRTLSGVVSMADMDFSAQKIQEDAQLDEMRYNIHDFTALSEALLSDPDIEFMAARANVAVHRNPRLKIAFVGNHPVVHKLMEAFNNFGYAPNRVVRFDTLNEARAYACR